MPTAIKAQPATWQHAKKSGIALYEWRRSIGVNRESFARFANLSERTLATYEKHKKFPRPSAPRLMKPCGW